LNAKDLEALGAERLAELLVELSTGNAGVKRRIRLELAQIPKIRGRGRTTIQDHMDTCTLLA
jgi:hypothetical protein